MAANKVDKRIGSFLLAASGLVLAVNAFLLPSFRLDDTYITFRYVANFAMGNGLVYNPGDPVEGISNLLWTILLTGFAVFEWDLLRVSRILSVLSAAGCLVLVFASVRRATGSTVAGGFGALLLASHMDFALWIYPGMETLFFSFLLTLLIYLLLVVADKPAALAPLFSVCLLCFVLPAVRPESILMTLAITTLGTAAAFGISRERSSVWPLASTLAGFLCLELLRYAYYGDWLPNTYYAKMDPGYASLTRLDTVVQVVENHPAAFLIAVLGGGILAWRIALGSVFIDRMGACPRALIGTTLGALSADMVFLWTAGLDWMPGWRYFLPVLPALCILAAFGVFQVFEALRQQFSLRWAIAAAGLISIIGISGQLFVRSPRVIAEARGQESFIAQSEISANELRQFISPGDTVAIAAAGLIPYTFLDAQFIDMLGLTDWHIARQGQKFSDFWEKIDVDYVLGRTPEFILIRYTHASGSLIPDPSKGCWPALYNHPGFQENYERVASLKGISLWLYQRIHHGEFPKE